MDSLRNTALKIEDDVNSYDRRSTYTGLDA